MTTNRLARSETSPDRPIPPQGNSPEQKAARERFWIEHGNQSLIASGRSHLEWRVHEGSYWIQPR
jgi:hypothetical protein